MNLAFMGEKEEEEEREKNKERRGKRRKESRSGKFPLDLRQMSPPL